MDCGKWYETQEKKKYPMDSIHLGLRTVGTSHRYSLIPWYSPYIYLATTDVVVVLRHVPWVVGPRWSHTN